MIEKDGVSPPRAQHMQATHQKGQIPRLEAGAHQSFVAVTWSARASDVSACLVAEASGQKWRERREGGGWGESNQREATMELFDRPPYLGFVKGHGESRSGVDGKLPSVAA